MDRKLKILILSFLYVINTSTFLFAQDDESNDGAAEEIESVSSEDESEAEAEADSEEVTEAQDSQEVAEPIPEVSADELPDTNQESTSEDKVDDLPQEERSVVGTQKEEENLDLSELEVLDEEDKKLLSEDDLGKAVKQETRMQISDQEEENEINSLQQEISEVINISKGPKKEVVDVQASLDEGEVKQKVIDQVDILDVGAEEKKLLEEVSLLKGKLTDDEWDTLNAASKPVKYVVQEGDYLWKISQRLFGSGFYYAKIWSLNPQITNPHEIEPGMVLVFETGDENLLPTVKMGNFEDFNEFDVKKVEGEVDLHEFGEANSPDWLIERKRLKQTGAFFQTLSEENYSDFNDRAKLKLNTEYKKFEPQIPMIHVKKTDKEYDEVGFDKSSKISFKYSDGFYLNTFVSTNIVQDFGYIEALPEERSMIHNFDRIYVNFDKNVQVKPGDLFSVYQPQGKVEHSISDRDGYQYTITAQIKAIRKINNLWECEVVDLSGITKRFDRVTVYTQRIEKIVQTFNDRNIEAAIVKGYNDVAKNFQFGDVVYLDRGRGDGVEIGNVFEVFSFFDRGTEKRITKDPTYKIGEITVISMTDDFATGLLTNLADEITLGNLAIAKSSSDALRMAKLKNKDVFKNLNQIKKEGLENLDLELDLTNVSDDLLKEAERIQLTDDEIEELERRELEKSVLSEHEKDLLDLERLENEIINAEAKLDEAKVDEDKFLETRSLDELEKSVQRIKDPNEFAAMDEVEHEVGRQFVDEDMNSKENPYGLSEFDLEELDELMNTGME